MSGILIFSENNATALELLTAGLGLKATMNQPLCAVALAEEDAAALAAAGADKVILLKGRDWPEGYAQPIAELAAKDLAAVILIGGTARGKDIAAKVADGLDAGLVTEAQTIEIVDDKLQTTRLKYGGLAVASEATVLPAVVTVAPRTFDKATAAGGQGQIISLDTADGDPRVKVSDLCPIERQGVDIAAAARIVCVGRGLSQKEDLALAEDLAKALTAEIGCTRGIAEDYHWLPVERYIGISGQKVKPEVYLSLGVSGQVQHVAGIRDSKIIVAVDSNEKAPIFEAADYGIVGDLYEVAPLLTAAFKK
ncbi:electron transfer flavoprotein subunit alpha/FixB family protein [Anaeroselena agilis]|uniref:Electron transfer flavoprotein subunit alpha/FixB family protein n=1 Tax=Anaeroselena agilis TaxID=3063788 RepID=A0ABU3P393_9FIRM|nr:electron transfer flavoprotein subunit alpha/FixB family protein [Selenomonadales bacterium 4137-cl]